MNDFLHGRILLYFVSQDIIWKILVKLGEEVMEEFNVNLSFEMGSALP